MVAADAVELGIGELTEVGARRGATLARLLVLPAMDEWTLRLDERLARICRYQMGIDELARQASGAGKLVRPALCLLSAAAAGGEAAQARAVPACVATEFVHNATLIQDDIMDGDRLRRHRPTVWARFGVPSAILASDALLALSFEVLCENRHAAALRASADLARTLRVLSMGQERDLRYERAETVSTQQCLNMLEAKTGVLLGYACRAGAAYADAPQEWGTRFDRFGTLLGVAYQLVDDLLGIWGDPAVTGKPAGSDIGRRKKSAPVVAALSSGTAEAARLAEIYALRRPMEPDEVEAAAELVEQAGGMAWTRRQVHRHVDSALRLIEPLDLDPRARADLEHFATGLAERADLELADI